MAQRGDPGYKATAVLLGESGLALATDRDALSDLRGVLTPAAAMGDALLARLPGRRSLAGDRAADASLTIGLLWKEPCRTRSAGASVIGRTKPSQQR